MEASGRARTTHSPVQAPDAVTVDALDALMDRYARGEDAAFARLHATLGPRVLAFLTRLSGSTHRAQDLTQETFLRIHRARGSFAPGAAVVPWAMAIARNTFRDELRRGKHREVLDDDAEHGPVVTARSTAATSEELAIAQDAARTVQQVLERLPVSQREAFVLLRFEGLSVAQAAEVLDATETAVKLRAFRAYESLRAALSVEKSPR